jgi:hypothetical protein
VWTQCTSGLEHTTHAIAEQRHLNHNNPDELIELIASEMRKQGLDPTNEGAFDSYLNPDYVDMKSIQKQIAVPNKLLFVD